MALQVNGTTVIDNSRNATNLVNVTMSGNLAVTGSSTFTEILEQCTIVQSGISSSPLNFDALTQGVIYYSANNAANWTLNVRGNVSTSLNSSMAIGQSLTFSILVTNGATPYRQTGFTIDGTAVTPRWAGGSAPTAGSANSIDLYTVTVIKTGNSAYTALESFTKYA